MRRKRDEGDGGSSERRRGWEDAPAEDGDAEDGAAEDRGERESAALIGVSGIGVADGDSTLLEPKANGEEAAAEPNIVPLLLLASPPSDMEDANERNGFDEADAADTPNPPDPNTDPLAGEEADSPNVPNANRECGCESELPLLLPPSENTDC